MLAGLSLGVADDESAVTEQADPQEETSAKTPDDDPQTICELIETASAAHDLPVAFFTRLIWKESRFKPDAISPKGAQGIAQFMPGTAALRRLSDPFDPIEAIPASAAYLRELTDRFGNLGLAAAAYNAGEKRVENWMAGTGGLPWETRDYVVSITGLTAEDWQDEAITAAAGTPDDADCLELATLLASRSAGAALVRRIEKAGWAPWGAQVAGNFSQNRAIGAYERLKQRHPKAFGEGPPMVVRSIVPGRGRAPVFQVRLPAESRQQANELCARIRSAGGPCMVVKTR